MEVWRVAHRTSKILGFPQGPLADYISDELDVMCRAHGSLDGKHPTPGEDDVLRWIAPHERCGFTDVGNLLRWFEPKWRPVLIAHGFCVYVYEVPRHALRVGECGQVVFDSAAALLMRIIDLDDCEEEKL